MDNCNINTYIKTRLKICQELYQKFEECDKLLHEFKLNKDKLEFKKYRVSYFRLQKFLINEYKDIRDPKVKRIIKRVGKIYQRTKKLYDYKKIPF